jgi:copper chaperone CopZ
MKFVLKLTMNCSCRGCRGKVRGAMRELTLAPGVDEVDSSVAESSGEVRLLATADPDQALPRQGHRQEGRAVATFLQRAGRRR